MITNKKCIGGGTSARATTNTSSYPPALYKSNTTIGYGAYGVDPVFVFVNSELYKKSIVNHVIKQENIPVLYQFVVTETLYVDIL